MESKPVQGSDWIGRYYPAMISRFAFVRVLLTTMAGLWCLPACAQQPVVTSPGEAPPDAGSFKVVFDASLQSEPYTGRVYVALSPWGQPELRTRAFRWYQPPQVFAVDVENLAPGGSVDVGTDALAFPKSMKEAATGALYVQAFARRNSDSPSPGEGAGDLYSPVTRVTFRAGEGAAKELVLSNAVVPRKFPQTERVREFTTPSPALSRFHGREVTMRAGVILPKEWKEGETTTYPTLYFIWGFGSDHGAARQAMGVLASNPAADNVIIVVPDPSCYYGHSVFADSATNGPWGEAFTKDLIPALETQFRGPNDGQRRYVGGISSGGWSSLWLQVTYPDLFAGVWSHCPDPVDFRDFQRIDLYEPGANVYRDAAGERRPLARSAGKTTLWYDEFIRQESVMGPGGQIGSFEAVFSPRGADGVPRPLFDRATGKVDMKTSEAWEKYDINLVMSRNWETLGPKLAGRVNIFAGEEDTYFLEGAVLRLGETLRRLGSDARVEVVPGMIHAIHGPGVGSMFEAIATREATHGLR